MVSSSWLEVVAIGFVSGLLSGMFGIGGGIITTPAIRLLLHGTAISAVATPLPVIVPTAIAGGISYARRGLADVPAGIRLGAWGAVAAVAGAFGAGYVGGSALLLVTAAIIGYLAVDMVVHAGDDAPSAIGTGGAGRTRHAITPTPTALAIAGLVTGVYSGLLGLGGGFVLVPVLTRLFGFPAKRAIGTSLVAISILAVPGAVTHYALGHIDLPLALGLSLTVVPGALIGARVTAAASERHVRIGFASVLLIAGIILAANELGVLAR